MSKEKKDDIIDKITALITAIALIPLLIAFHNVYDTLQLQKTSLQSPTTQQHKKFKNHHFVKAKRHHVSTNETAAKSPDANNPPNSDTQSAISLNANAEKTKSITLQTDAKIHQQNLAQHTHQPALTRTIIYEAQNSQTQGPTKADTLSIFSNRPISAIERLHKDINQQPQSPSKPYGYLMSFGNLRKGSDDYE